MRGPDSSLTIGGRRNFAEVYGKLRPPLRPSPIDVANLSRSISNHDKRVLLLGVTPELSVLGSKLTAVDNSPRMLARKSGRAINRRGRAILGNWTDIPFADATFDAAIGDGSLNSAPDAVDEVLAETKRVLAPGGRAAFRLFGAPEQPETLGSILDDLAAGWPGNLHALKWRIAMSLVASRPRAIVPVREILAAFNQMFPDRAALAAAMGGKRTISRRSMPMSALTTVSDFRRFRPCYASLSAISPTVSVVTASGYPLAERCPTVICGERA